MSTPKLYLTENQVIPQGRLIEASWRREAGGVILKVKSKQIHDFFSDLPQGDGEAVHKGWKLKLFNPQSLPHVAEVTFDSQETSFSVAGGGGYFMNNLTFLRAKDLGDGVEVPIGPLVTETDLQDMKRVLKMTVIELYRNYMADFEDEMIIETRQAVRVA